MKEEENINEETTGIEEDDETRVSYTFEIIKIVIWSLIIIIPIRIFVFQPFFVKGVSMEPNFHDGEYLIVNEFGYKETDVEIAGKHLFKVDNFKDFKRGDVAVFHYPNDPKDFFIKRIVGLPGEKVVLKDGRIIIHNDRYPDGNVVDEGVYMEDANISSTSCSGRCDFKLGEEQYFVLGDNRKHSSDSRVWGKLDQEYVVGRVLIRAWPITEFKLF